MSNEEVIARASIKEVLCLAGVAASYLETPRRPYLFSVESLALAGIRALIKDLPKETAKDVLADAMDELYRRLDESCKVRR